MPLLRSIGHYLFAVFLIALTAEQPKKKREPQNNVISNSLVVMVVITLLMSVPRFSIAEAIVTTTVPSISFTLTLSLYLIMAYALIT